jgi:hypothetical protein
MKKVVFFISIITVMYSCRSGAGLKFSDQIVEKEKSLEPEIKKTEAQVKDFIAARQFDSMAAVSEKLERLVDTRLNEIRDLKAPNLKFADDFKKDAIDYFIYIRSVYTGYVRYARAETAEKRDEEFKKIQQIVSNKDAIIKTMRASQEKFAKENGFLIKD